MFFQEHAFPHMSVLQKPELPGGSHAAALFSIMLGLERLLDRRPRFPCLRGRSRALAIGRALMMPARIVADG